MKIAFMFSGQGAQQEGMGKDLYDTYPLFKEIFDHGDSLLDFSLKDICFKGGEALNQTEYAQPALLAVSAAIIALLKEENIEASMAAGLSLGEYSALFYSGAFSFEDSLRLVRKRGLLMANACKAGFGSMSAILNLSPELTQRACEEASTADEKVYPANFNAPGQIVISGEVNALERAEKLCLAYGAGKAVRLNVSGPFHTPYLKEASEKLSEELESININTPSVPVITNFSAKEMEDIKQTLPLQMVSPVKWEESVRYMLSQEVDTFIEIGAGKTLCSFVKKISKDVNIYNVDSAQSFEKTIQKIKEGKNA
ncbi:ACP S-malonyltransferase [Anaeropeptidivorans aminofermentans]|jgi:[acyl-carrier-protein] S-malonyltransferase|uniref:ACP S-malonyltransferase n=1 Tax=Anaeropeptidivorans aminofermentans TaxID=2934315 RepID=UPI0020242A21|nr:ACP S-malonyltransferase [Anaeropeptidivorans aminofermentans]